jgi:hypothetical protein
LDTANEDPDDLPTSLLTYSFVVISYFLYILQIMTAPFLDAFAKLRKVTIRFVTSVSPHVTTRLPLDEFS